MRYRLVNDFMKVGAGPGESIPVYRRELAYPSYTGPSSIEGGLVVWTDATQALGHYLAMLALEYRILKGIQ